MNESEHQNLFSSDRPIETATQDILGRTSFVNGLSQAIISWRGKDSLVIGLNGSWGCGKTSIKNLLLESIAKQKEQRVEFADINPWQWAGQEQLAQAFFGQIGRSLKRSFDTEKWDKLSKKWKLYGAYLGVGSRLSEGTQQGISFLLAISLILVLVPAAFIGDTLKTWFFYVGFIGAVLAAVLSWAQSFAQGLSTLFESKASVHSKSLKEIRSEIADKLRHSDKTLLVVMDDLDRLSAEEARLVIQLVKANADFPNVVYLLLFERGLIEKHLDEISAGKGKEFLEKIVQVSFDVPTVDRRRVWKALTIGFDQILATPAAAEHFDGTRYSNMFVGYLRDYFETLRDVNRFLGSLSFHAVSFTNADVFEVNPIDLIAVEVLRNFEPQIYHRLSAAKTLLTGSAARMSLLGINRDQAKKTIQSLIGSLPEDRRERVESLLRELFPPIDTYFEGGTGFDSSFWEQWTFDLRICTEYFFDRYFQMAVTGDQISEREIKDVLSVVHDRDLLVAQFQQYNANNRLVALMERLSVYGGKVAVDATIPFVTALFDISDQLPGEEAGIFDITAGQHINGIVFRQMRLERDPKKRAELLESALVQTNGVTAPVSYLSIESAKEGKRKVTEENTIEDASLLADLRKLTAGKIEQKAVDGSLVSVRGLRSALAAWRDWGSKETMRCWVESLVQSEMGVKRILVAFLQETRSYGVGAVPTRSFWMSLKSIEGFIDPETLASYLGLIDQSRTTEEEKLAVSTFQRAMVRKMEGKPDTDWERDD